MSRFSGVILAFVDVIVWSWGEDFSHVYAGIVLMAFSGISYLCDHFPVAPYFPDDPISEELESFRNMGDFGLFL